MEILQQIIRTESHVPSLRRETMKVLGIVGALDPYKYQVRKSHSSIPFVQLRLLQIHGSSVMSEEKNDFSCRNPILLFYWSTSTRSNEG